MFNTIVLGLLIFLLGGCTTTAVTGVSSPRKEVRVVNDLSDIEITVRSTGNELWREYSLTIRNLNPDEPVLVSAIHFFVSGLPWPGEFAIMPLPYPVSDWKESIGESMRKMLLMPKGIQKGASIQGSLFFPASFPEPKAIYFYISRRHAPQWVGFKVPL